MKSSGKSVETGGNKQSMGEVRKLASRKAAIAELLADGEKLKNFYRFAAQNPHIELYDACQIILARPDASVCFSFEDWNAMGRRIQSGSKGIPYCDREKNRLFVFDADDTYGEKRYIRESYPVKRLLTGFDFLNNKEQSEEAESNYEKVLFKVKLYLKRNPYIRYWISMKIRCRLSMMRTGKYKEYMTETISKSYLIIIRPPVY
jgi:hypothetical protein